MLLANKKVAEYIYKKLKIKKQFTGFMIFQIKKK